MLIKDLENNKMAFLVRIYFFHVHRHCHEIEKNTSKNKDYSVILFYAASYISDGTEKLPIYRNK